MRAHPAAAPTGDALGRCCWGTDTRDRGPSPPGASLAVPVRSAELAPGRSQGRDLGTERGAESDDPAE